MNCFIHSKIEASTYCVNCKRPICSYCSEHENGLCPRCSNFIHKTIFEYNKKILKFFIPFIIVRFIIYWDLIMIFLFSEYEIMDYLVGVVLLNCCFIPFIINVIKYGFIMAVKFQIIGKNDPILIADNLSWKSTHTIVLSIISSCVLVLLSLFITPIFIITDIIHLIILIINFIIHRKKYISETKIIKMDKR